LPISSDAFYLSELPTSLQQGDIVNGVPLILVPPLDSLVIVRSTHHKLPFDQNHLVPGQAELVDERVLNDAFERGTEYSVTSVLRGLAMLVTPTWISYSARLGRGQKNELCFQFPVVMCSANLSPCRLRSKSASPSCAKKVQISEANHRYVQYGKKMPRAAGDQERRLQRLQEILDELVALTDWKKL
jgi:hypothetical protein